MKLLAVATHSQGYLPYLKETSVQCGFQLILLGYGQTWRNNRWKIDLTYEYLQTLPRDEIIMSTDAFDVIVTRHSEEVLRRYFEFQKPIVFSVNDTQGNPIIDMFLRNKYGACDEHGHTINAGTYLGRVDAILEMLQLCKYVSDRHESDQQLISLLYANMPIWWKMTIALDTKSEIFNVPHCKFHETWKQVDMYLGANANCEFDDTKGCVIHGPGNFDLNPTIEKMLGVSVPDDIRQKNKSATPVIYKSNITLRNGRQLLGWTMGPSVVGLLCTYNETILSVDEVQHLVVGVGKTILFFNAIGWSMALGIGGWIGWRRWRLRHQQASTKPLLLQDEDDLFFPDK